MKIYVASHKYTDMPYGSPYVPLFVGASQLSDSERKPGWEYDDTFPGNISDKNKTYCELTGLYWIWKQSHEDIVGLVHYRRYFRSPSDPNRPISESEILQLLQNHDCIVATETPCYASFGPGLSTVAEQYRACHVSTDLIQLASSLRHRDKHRYTSLMELMTQRHSFHPCNMIICSKDLLNRYADWLFMILAETEHRIDPYTDRDIYQQRVFGFLAERLLNVFLDSENIKAASCDILDPSEPGKCLSPGRDTWPEPRQEPTQDFPKKAVLDKIDYSPVFDYRFYYEHNSDIALAFPSDPYGALNHYLTFGIKEGRMAHPRFSIESYVNGNPHLRKLFGDDRRAYLDYYLAHPFDRAHAIGYENLMRKDDEGRSGEQEDSPIRSMRLSLYRLCAERRGVID